MFALYLTTVKVQRKGTYRKYRRWKHFLIFIPGNNSCMSLYTANRCRLFPQHTSGWNIHSQEGQIVSVEFSVGLSFSLNHGAFHFPRESEFGARNARHLTWVESQKSEMDAVVVGVVGQRLRTTAHVIIVCAWKHKTNILYVQQDVPQHKNHMKRETCTKSFLPIVTRNSGLLRFWLQQGVSVDLVGPELGKPDYRGKLGTITLCCASLLPLEWELHQNFVVTCLSCGNYF